MSSINSMIYVSEECFCRNFPVDNVKYAMMYKKEKDMYRYDQDGIYTKLMTKLKLGHG